MTALWNTQDLTLEKWGYTANGRLQMLDEFGDVDFEEEGTGVVIQPLSGAFPFGLSSAWRSPTTGLVQMRARWYSPALGEFVSIDELKAAYDKGKAMVILDARPPADYVRSHTSGAVSVPFYAVKDYLDQLPKDKWIVAYCACPHAESGKAAKALKDNGYTKVKVFNEGFIEWRTRKYPITTGPKP